MKVAVLGSGAFGLALAKLFSKNNNVVLYSNSEIEIHEILITRRIKAFPGYKIDDSIEFTANIEKAVKDATLIVFAVPSFAVEEVAKELHQYLDGDEYILIASKGIEKSELLSNIVFNHTRNEKIAVLGGGTFAKDIINDKEIGCTIASKNIETLIAVDLLLKQNQVITETTSDLIRTEICGPAKNVYAICIAIAFFGRFFWRCSPYFTTGWKAH